MEQNLLLLPRRRLPSNWSWILPNRHCHPFVLHLRQIHCCLHPLRQPKPRLHQSHYFPQRILSELHLSQLLILDSLLSAGGCQLSDKARHQRPHLLHLSHSSPLHLRLIRGLWPQHPKPCCRQLRLQQIRCIKKPTVHSSNWSFQQQCGLPRIQRIHHQ